MEAYLKEQWDKLKALLEEGGLLSDDSAKSILSAISKVDYDLNMKMQTGMSMVLSVMRSIGSFREKASALIVMRGRAIELKSLFEAGDISDEVFIKRVESLSEDLRLAGEAYMTMKPLLDQVLAK